MAEITVKGKQMIVKEVKPASSSAIIYLPKDWAGHKVAVILDPED